MEPEGITTVYNGINNLTLAWREPAESYGQDILFYSISCTSLSNHTITIESVLRMSAHVTGLNSNTNYTCCVSAMSSVGPGNSVCISVSIAGKYLIQSIIGCGSNNTHIPCLESVLGKVYFISCYDHGMCVHAVF